MILKRNVIKLQTFVEPIFFVFICKSNSKYNKKEEISLLEDALKIFSIIFF